MSATIRKEATKTSDEITSKFTAKHPYFYKGTKEQDTRDSIDYGASSEDLVHAKMPLIKQWSREDEVFFDFKTDKNSEQPGGKYAGKTSYELLRVDGKPGSIFGKQLAFIHYNNNKPIFVRKEFCQRYLYENYKITPQKIIQLHQELSTERFSADMFPQLMNDKELVGLLLTLSPKFSLIQLREKVYRQIRYLPFRELLATHKSAKKIMASEFRPLCQEILDIKQLNVTTSSFQDRIDWGHLDLCLPILKQQFIEEGIQALEIFILED